MRLQPEDEVSLRRIGGLAIAPDGEDIVYAVSEVDLINNRRTTRLWRCATRDGHARPLTTGGDNERFPRWSPDGASVAIVSGGADGDRLMIVPGIGGRPRELLGPVAGFVPSDIFGSRPGSTPVFAWAPDSRSIACLLQSGAQVPGDSSVEGPRMVGDPMVAVEITQRLRGGPAVRLVVLDVAERSFKEVGTADRPLSHLTWTPDGTAIYAVTRADARPAGTSDFRLLRFSLDGAEPTIVAAFSGAAFAPTLSPDGRQFAVSAARGTDNAPSPCLLLLPAGGGDQRDLAMDDLTTYSDLTWLPSGAAVMAVADSGIRRHLVTVCTESGAVATLASGESWIEMARTSADGTTIAFVGSRLDDPGDVFVRSATGGTCSRLTDTNPHRTAIDWGTGGGVTWQAEDGSTIEGILILPPGNEPGTPVPLIIDYHGGPASHVTLGWNGQRQVFAAAGYATFAPNFRGGTGYGSAFSEALRGDIGGKPFTDSIAGVDDLIAQGIADPERMFAYGHSWGGYMTNWTATQTNRFRAIVSSGSVSDLISVFHTRYSADVWEWRLRGTPDESPEQYLKWSPIRYADQVRVPILFLNGTADRTTPPTQGLEMFTALRMREIPAEFVLYPREGHVAAEPAHQIDRMKRVLDWFERYRAFPPIGPK